MRQALLLAAAALCTITACSRNPMTAAPGSRLRLSYTLTVDGQIDDTTDGKGPLALTVGEGALPQAVESALIGMHVGEEKSITLQPSQAYGVRDPRQVVEIPRADIGPLDAQLEPGKIVLGLREGKAARARVDRLSDSSVWLDFNHRLAGKTVTFRLKVLALR